MPDAYGNMTYADLNAQTQMRQLADSVAQQTYYDALARGSDAGSALAEAKFRWQQKLDEATQTGQWNGQWNMPSNQWFTGQFGTWMPQGPQSGQETLQKQQQDYQQAFNLSQLYGQYYAPGTAPGAGNQTQQQISQAQQQALAQANLTGYYTPVANTTASPNDFFMQDQATQQQYLQYNQNDPQAAATKWAQDAQAAMRRFVGENPDYGRTQTLAGNQQQFMQALQTQQEARAAQGQQQQQTKAYLNLLAQLRGPADWAKYQQVLGSTPGGVRDLVAAAMGQYVPGGGATTGMAPQAVSLQSLQGDVSGQPYTGPGGGQLGQPNVYTGGQGSYGQSAGQVWGSGIGVGANQGTPQQQQQGLGNGTNLPAPNQISAQSWNNMAPSQQQMLLGMYESQGWDKNDVLALHNQSLPKYATNSATAGTWRLS